VTSSAGCWWSVGQMPDPLSACMKPRCKNAFVVGYAYCNRRWGGHTADVSTVKPV
jgi:hypothetical protein